MNLVRYGKYVPPTAYMVREPTDDESSETVDKSERNSNTFQPPLNRRSYLKLAGTAAVATAGVSAASASDDYEVITVGRGETYSKRLSNGETWENVLIDITARGAGYTIRAHANDFTIRNLGIRGKWDYEPTSSPFTVRVPNVSSSGLIENVYLPGGEGNYSDDRWANPTGIYVHGNHAGELEIRRVFMKEFVDQGVYASDTAHPEFDWAEGGRTVVRDSYFEDCRIPVRLGTNPDSRHDPDLAENVVVNRVWDGRHGIRAYWGNGTIARNCDVYNPGGIGYSAGSSTYHGGGRASCGRGLILEECRGDASQLHHGECGIQGSADPNPRTEPPERVPLSPEEAASGETSSADDSEEPAPQGPDVPDEDFHLVTFITNPEARYANYDLSAEGRLEPVEAPYESPSGSRISADGVTIAEDDGIYSVSELSGGGFGDAYEVYGPVTDVSIEQPDVMWIELDGEEVTEAELIARTSGEDNDPEEEFENTILIDGVGTTGSTRYEFGVSGDVEKSTLKGGSIDEEDIIDSGQVTGSVAGWRDAFRFSGELENLTVDGPARVFVNDEQVDPSKYGEELPHVLTIVGNGTESNYEATVDGTIDTLVGEDVGETVEISADTTVSGTIERDIHRFRFSGELVDFNFTEGGTQVYVDRQRIDPDDYDENRELPPHVIVIDGSASDEPTTYSFTTSGDVIKSSYRDASVDDVDEIDGTTVRGTVDDELDAYWFDGDIADFRLAGNASVDVEYHARSE